MSFDVAADAYDRFMGRYSTVLAPAFADFAGVRAGQRALDVGCGPGALTAELVRAARAGRPLPRSIRRSPSSRLRGTASRRRRAARRPRRTSRIPTTHSTSRWRSSSSTSCPIRSPGSPRWRGSRAPGGVVAACVWDFAGDRAPISAFWQAAREVDADVRDESDLPGRGRATSAELFEVVGLRDVRGDGRSSSPIELPDLRRLVGAVRARGRPRRGLRRYARAEAERAALRERCRAILLGEPFT